MSSDAQKVRETIAPNHNYFQRLIMDDRSKKSMDEIDRSGFPGFHQKKSLPYNLNEYMKKNFDEIDASGFRGFVKKNFDEIDRSSFNDFGKRNFDEIDASGFRGFDKKNLYGSFDIDRRDLEKYQRLHFPDYLKISRMGPRSYMKSDLDDIGNVISTRLQKKNFDEIDRSGFPGFNKRF